MKKLSVIIVNYNVRHFLEQCLLSVREAVAEIDAEIYVVDNNSVDGSQAMVKENFPEVNLIESQKNLGFSKGNNLAIRQAEGEYILLLNPDTVVEESTFKKCIDFMDARPKAGALGVKMLDGEGRFLPESKRALPTPWVSFYKIFGLSRFFPKSKKFGKYHLGYLNKDENHEVDVLSGAFMMIRKECLDKIGLLDEAFFMYGEDIDLSYRLTQEGYKNYYFSDTKIIHYKGESTKKGSLNYVKVFYNAMIVFARKHFSRNRQNIFIFLIHLAIYFRAFLAVGSRVIRRISFPLIEALMLYGAILGIKEYWEYIHKLQKNGRPYPEEFDYLAAPIYTLVFISFLWIAGGYKKPFRVKPIQTAALSGFVAIATVSYIFPEINFSRMIVGLSSVALAGIALINRNIVNYWNTGSFFFTEENKRRVVVVGMDEEVERIKKLIRSELIYPVVIEGSVSLDKMESTTLTDWLGTVSQLDEIVKIYKVDEVIFANQSMSTEQIISIMSSIQRTNLSYKIVPPGADYLIGPNVIHASRDGHSIFYSLDLREVKFRKRLFDVFGSLALLFLFPILFVIYPNPLLAFRNLWRVILGKYHLVGYIEDNPPGLPELKKGVLNMLHRAGDVPESLTHFLWLDRYYARSYSPELDWEILLKGIRNLGR